MDEEPVKHANTVTEQLLHVVDKQEEASQFQEYRRVAAGKMKERSEKIADTYARKLENEAASALDVMSSHSTFKMDSHLKHEVTSKNTSDADVDSSAARNIVLDELFTQVLDESHKYQQTLINDSLPSRLPLFFKPAIEIEPVPDSDDEEIAGTGVHRMRNPDGPASPAASPKAAQLAQPSSEDKKSVFSMFF